MHENKLKCSFRWLFSVLTPAISLDHFVQSCVCVRACMQESERERESGLRSKNRAILLQSRADA